MSLKTDFACCVSAYLNKQAVVGIGHTHTVQVVVNSLGRVVDADVLDAGGSVVGIGNDIPVAVGGDCQSVILLLLNIRL